MFSKLASIATLVLAASSVVAAPADVATSPNSLEKRIKHEGTATYFAVGLGACGWWNQDSDYVVAMNSAQFGNGKNCGQKLAITNKNTGKTIIATQVDECPTCDYGSLDMSPSLFQALGASLDDGVFPVKWNFKKKD